MGLKDNLIQLMKDKSLTIKELSEITDISEPTLKRLRTKECNPTLDVLIKLSQALDVSLNELVQSNDTPLEVYYQGTKELPNQEEESFIFIFTQDTFNFKTGTKALFKRYKGDNTLTKYILNKEGQILEKMVGNEFTFVDNKQVIYSVLPENILAYIVKQLYEVNYV